MTHNASSSGVTATVDHDRCIGVGECLQSSPGGFDFEDTGLAVFVPSGEWTEDELRLAADNCPNSAITVFRDGTQVS
jgi:ferredoxin